MATNPVFPALPPVGPDALDGGATGAGQVGVRGRNKDPGGIGVIGSGGSTTGVHGNTSSPGIGVLGEGQFGVRGESPTGTGFLGGIDPVFHNHAGVFGQSDQQGVIGVATGDGTGVFGTGGKFAARFEGAVSVKGAFTHDGDCTHNGALTTNGPLHTTGNISTTADILLTNADCAEEFDIADAETVDPGTVMVIDREGTLRQSRRAYDKRVAGVISGAGDHRPAITLDKQSANKNRMPIALMGKVFCKVDARDIPVDVGDLLTTSTTPGHAMKANDVEKAFGSVIGKALRPLSGGQGLIPILIALQ